MPENYYSNESFLIKRKNSGFFKKIKSMLTIVFLLGIIGFGTVYGYNALASPNFSVWDIFYSYDINIKGKTLYALSMGEYSSYEKAQEVSMGTSLLGAASYIWEKDNSFFVLASVYQNREDCERVIQNIGDTRFSLSTIEFPIASLKFNLKDMSKEDKIIIKDTLNFIQSLYKKYYDRAISLEKKDITPIACASFLNSYKGELMVYYASLLTLKSDVYKNKISKINEYLIQIQNSLDNTISTLIQNNNPSQEVKYGLCQFVNFYQKLFAEIGSI